MHPRKIKRKSGRPARKQHSDSDEEQPKKIKIHKVDEVKIPEEQLKNAIRNILTETKYPSECHPNICSLMDGTSSIPQPFPDSTFRILYEIRNCLLNENWDGYARLMSLIAENEERFKYYRHIFQKVYLTGFFYDPVLKGEDYLSVFLKTYLNRKNKSEMEKNIKNLTQLRKLHDEPKEGAESSIWLPTVKEPDINFDEIDMEKSENILQLFNKQKRRTFSVQRAAFNKK